MKFRNVQIRPASLPPRTLKPKAGIVLALTFNGYAAMTLQHHSAQSKSNSKNTDNKPHTMSLFDNYCYVRDYSHFLPCRYKIPSKRDRLGVQNYTICRVRRKPNLLPPGRSLRHSLNTASKTDFPFNQRSKAASERDPETGRSLSPPSMQIRKAASGKGEGPWRVGRKSGEDPNGNSKRLSSPLLKRHTAPPSLPSTASQPDGAPRRGSEHLGGSGDAGTPPSLCLPSSLPVPRFR